jgi:hypothetical protein
MLFKYIIQMFYRESFHRVHNHSKTFNVYYCPSIKIRSHSHFAYLICLFQKEFKTAELILTIP